MILPVVAYGDPVLKLECEDIDVSEKEAIQQLIIDMWETTYNANGVGLAAPQIGKPIRLFLVDTAQVEPEEGEEFEGIKKVFINPEIIDEWGDPWFFNEGCLSLPKIREDVERLPNIRINYLDENFEEHEEDFDGFSARVIQHEYDHIEGIVFTDHLKPLKRKLLKGKLDDISKGKVNMGYKMRYPLVSKRKR